MSEELSENIEVVTPGQLLQEARASKGLSQQDVAAKLNLKPAVIENIESNEFEKLGSQTFVRGYIRAYAKLVNVSESEVFSAFEHFDVATKQSSEMQSFSKRTERLSHDTKLMWVSYVVGFIIVASFLAWWWQERDTLALPSLEISTGEPVGEAVEVALPAESSNDAANAAINTDTSNKKKVASNAEVQQSNKADTSNIQNPDDQQTTAKEISNTSTSSESETLTASDLAAVAQTSKNAEGEWVQAEPSRLTMLFSKDCWINVVDSTEDRIAYGTKKEGYEMNVKGIAPFQVTVCSPGAVIIQLDGEDVDLSSLSQNIAANFEVPIE
ncbi:RodZ domain-containing protein [Flocculibacter collagenilyticus]|uniref:RodZ domain-containing protein n=1 Tax=Flocculibacter collagenilyticus TaxID=2744479 RepID=UPI0018F56F7D|nr:RodZ domain-containing protein [Flocculibacter collagenilyticus]